MKKLIEIMVVGVLMVGSVEANTLEEFNSYTPVHESPLFTTLEIKDVESFKREAIST